jgi:hypothetical protein
MTEGGFLPYEFFSEFELDMLEFDSSDALQNFGPKQKFLMSGSFIFTQFLINRMLLKPQENGFNTEISTASVHNLYILAALIHGIYSEVMYDTFKSNLIQQRILLPDQSNR